MKAPEIIYLTDEGSNFEGEIYWCEDNVGENDVKYIRSDLVKSAPRELSDEEIKEALWITGNEEPRWIEERLRDARAILKKASEK